MLIRVTETQRDALPIIDQDGSAPGIARETLTALLAKGLIVSVPVAGQEGLATEYVLTGDARLLCGEITERPADGPADPHESDPFAAFDQD